MHLHSISRVSGPEIGGTSLKIEVTVHDFIHICIFDSTIIVNAEQINNTFYECTTPSHNMTSSVVTLQICENVHICSEEIFNFEYYKQTEILNVNVSTVYAGEFILISGANIHLSHQMICVMGGIYFEVIFCFDHSSEIWKFFRVKNFLNRYRILPPQRHAVCSQPADNTACPNSTPVQGLRKKFPIHRMS